MKKECDENLSSINNVGRRYKHHNWKKNGKMISIRSRSHYADQTPKPTELPHNGNLFSSRIFPGLSSSEEQLSQI